MVNDVKELLLAEFPRFFTNSAGIEFILIPSGNFMMGSGEGDDEKPVHKVTIREPFYLGKYPVTQKQWKAVMGRNPSEFNGYNLPVENVSWYDVQEFLEKLNCAEKTDMYRLPSEAEWEYACRAGTTTRYSFGNDESKLGDYAWYKGLATVEEFKNKEEILSGDTHPVGQKKPNPWGLYDMHGNVWEWCQDYWHDNYNGAPSDGSSWESGSNSYHHVIRGGCWIYFSGICMSASRAGYVPDSGASLLGFRILRDLPTYYSTSLLL